MTNVLDLVAYKNGEYKPLGEIGPSILDFGFIHCDATYDVMRGLSHFDKHYKRFEANSSRGCKRLCWKRSVRSNNLN